MFKTVQNFKTPIILCNNLSFNHLGDNFNWPLKIGRRVSGVFYRKIARSRVVPSPPPLMQAPRLPSPRRSPVSQPALADRSRAATGADVGTRGPECVMWHAWPLPPHFRAPVSGAEAPRAAPWRSCAAALAADPPWRPAAASGYVNAVPLSQCHMLLCSDQSLPEDELDAGVGFQIANRVNLQYECTCMNSS